MRQSWGKAISTLYFLFTKKTEIKNSDFKSLQYSTLISLIGDELTNMAILTLIYNITHSASLVASTYIFRTLAIFTSGLIVPATIGMVKNRKKLLLAIDITRAILISFLIFFPLVTNIYIFIFISYLLNGFYYPVKQAAVQTLISSEKRAQFISITQTYTYVVHFTAPLLAGLMLLYISPRMLIGIDAISFLVSAALLIKLSNLYLDEAGENGGKFFNRLFSGYQKIFFTSVQRNLLTFRLLLLLSLSIYDVLVTMVITNFAKNIAYYGFPKVFTFSLLLGLFSSFTAIATMLASLCTQQLSSDKIELCAKLGLMFLISGLMFWACPISFKYCWIIFIFGTFLIGFGLSFSRFFLYTAGYELTEKSLFVQIVSSSDAIARLWQSCISTATITISTLLPVGGVIIASCFVMSFAIVPIKKLISTLNDRSNRLDTLQKI